MSWYTFFSQIINMSLTGSAAIAVVVLARLLLKRAPKIISYGLWAIVLVRLLCPLAFPSDLSFLSLWDAPVKEAAVGNRMEYISIEGQPVANMPGTDSGTASWEDLRAPYIENMELADINTATRTDNGQKTDHIKKPSVTVTVEHPLAAEKVLPVAALWMLGAVLMVLYGSITCLKLRRSLVGAIHVRDHIFMSDYITSPFVMGVFRPRIYLPSSLGEREQSYILLHEQHHIQRLDHVFRMLAFLALCIHWFNPLAWLAFVLSGRDMEMSCDEAVVKRLGEEIRADYSASLLGFATGRRINAGMPLAFGEGDPAGRIRNLARWKRPAFHAVLVAFAFSGILAVVLLTNPREKELPGEGASGGLTCRVTSEEGDVDMDPSYFPEGFDFNYDRVINCRVSGEGTLAFTAGWAPKELLVGEDYYEYRNFVKRKTYRLQPNAAGEYELNISHRNPGKEEKAFYYIPGEKGKYVLEIQFSAESITDNRQK